MFSLSADNFMHLEITIAQLVAGTLGVIKRLIINATIEIINIIMISN